MYIPAEPLPHSHAVFLQFFYLKKVRIFVVSKNIAGLVIFGSSTTLDEMKKQVIEIKNLEPFFAEISTFYYRSLSKMAHQVVMELC